MSFLVNPYWFVAESVVVEHGNFDGSTAGDPYGGSTDCETFSIADDTWTIITSNSLSRSFLSGGINIIIGGADGANIYTNTTEQYDSAGDSWSSAGNLAKEIGDGNGADGNIDDSDAITAAGTDEATGTGSTYTATWNGTSWQTVASCSYSRYLAAGSGRTNDFILVNGYQSGAACYTDNCELYDGSGDSWSTIASTSQKKTSPACTGDSPSSSNVMSSGGNNDPCTGTKSRTVVSESYDASGDSWNTLDDLPTATKEGSAGGDNTSSCYSSGDTVSDSFTSATFIYDGTGDSWSTGTSLTKAVQGQAGH